VRALCVFDFYVFVHILIKDKFEFMQKGLLLSSIIGKRF